MIYHHLGRKLQRFFRNQFLFIAEHLLGFL